MIDFFKAFAGVFGVHASANGWTYSFYSGVGSDITELALIGALWRHMNCQKQGCWRLGRHTAGQYRVCHAHHPGVDARSVSQDTIDEAHRQAS